MSAATTTDLLVIGAGPFGLSMAAHARHLGIDHIIVGEPMRFWHAHMPNGMYLRSACDWHLDPEDEDTIQAFLQTRGLTPSDVEPLSRDLYLEYARWFQDRKRIDPWPVLVHRLDADEGGDGCLLAALTDGGTIKARSVVLALGFEPFKNVPDEVKRLLPARHVAHTCDVVDFRDVRGLRCLIVGGRQSAFEWAALMCEAGATAVHVSHRHDSPAFAGSDWTWVNPLVDGIVANPGWFRRLTPAEKDAVNHRLWAEGRLKLEPWLASRVHRPEITLWPRTRVVGADAGTDGGLTITLDGETGARALEIDRIVLATGYKVDINRVPLLARGNLLPRLQVDNGAPRLDEHMQSSVEGLFMTSLMATRDFGPFFGFTVAARTSSKLIGQALQARS